jgi:hypothetical protein
MSWSDIKMLVFGFLGYYGIRFGVPLFWITCWIVKIDDDPFNDTMFGVPINDIYSWFGVYETASLFHLLGLLVYVTGKCGFYFAYSLESSQDEELLVNMTDEERSAVLNLFKEVDTGIRIDGKPVTKVRKKIPDYITGPVFLLGHFPAGLMSWVMYYKWVVVPAFNFIGSSALSFLSKGL